MTYRCVKCGKKWKTLPLFRNEFGKSVPENHCAADAPKEEQYLKPPYRVMCYGRLEKVESK